MIRQKTECHPELLPEPVVAEHRRSIEGQDLILFLFIGFYGLVPVSVETQNFASVLSMATRRGAIVQYSKKGVAAREIEQIGTNLSYIFCLIAHFVSLAKGCQRQWIKKRNPSS